MLRKGGIGMSKLQIAHGGSKLDINLILGSWRYVKVIVNDDLTIDMRVPIGMKQEMITIASMMAGKVVSASMNAQIQDELVDETLSEIGNETWQN